MFGEALNRAGFTVPKDRIVDAAVAKASRERFIKEERWKKEGKPGRPGRMSLARRI